MKKLLLISLLTISSPIFSMLRTQRVGTILLRNSTAMARTMATSQPPKEPLNDLDVQGITDCLDKLEIHVAKQKRIKRIFEGVSYAGAALTGMGSHQIGIPVTMAGFLGFVLTNENNYELEERVSKLREELEKIKPSNSD